MFVIVELIVKFAESILYQKVKGQKKWPRIFAWGHSPNPGLPSESARSARWNIYQILRIFTVHWYDHSTALYHSWVYTPSGKQVHISEITKNFGLWKFFHIFFT